MIPLCHLWSYWMSRSAASFDWMAWMNSPSATRSACVRENLLCKYFLCMLILIYKGPSLRESSPSVTIALHCIVVVIFSILWKSMGVSQWRWTISLKLVFLPLSFLSKKAQSFSALFSGVLSSLGRFACFSLGMRLKIAWWEMRESWIK